VPLAVSDAVYFTIEQAAAPIVANERPQFLLELAGELRQHPIIDVGLAHRCAAELQRRFTVEARSMAGSFSELRHLERERQRVG
jgi:hypothetical protein